MALYPCATFVLWPVPCHDPVKLTFTGGPRAYKLGPCRGCAESRLYWFAGRPRQGALAAPAELSVSFHMLAVATPVTKTGFPELAVLPSGFRHPEFSHLAVAAARTQAQPAVDGCNPNTLRLSKVASGLSQSDSGGPNSLYTITQNISELLGAPLLERRPTVAYSAMYTVCTESAAEQRGRHSRRDRG